MDLDYAEAGDIVFGSKLDDEHSVRSEPVEFSTAQFTHLSPLPDDDQITDLNHDHSIRSATVSFTRPVASLLHLAPF